MSDVSFVVSESWLRSWCRWPEGLVADSVLEEAVDWSVDALVCRCSRERVRALSARERLVFVFAAAAWVRAALAAAVRVSPGSRRALVVERCVGVAPCRLRRLARLTLEA